MKLRQKLAAVMAATMVVTAVPVITSATTTNTISISSVSMVKDGAIGFSLTENKNDNNVTTSTTYNVTNSNLTLDLESKGEYNLSADGQTFFVTIENAEFSKEAYHAKQNGTVTVDTKGNIVANPTKADAPTTITPVYSFDKNGLTTVVEVISKEELKVTVKPAGSNTTATVNSGAVISVPVFAIAKSGEVKLTVDGTDSFVTSGSHVLGTTSDKMLTATAVEPTKFSVEGGKLGKIVITESTRGAFASVADADKKIELTLPTSSDLEFATTQSNVKVTPARGYNAGAFDGFKVSVEGQKLTIDLKDCSFAQSATGEIHITGVEVVPEGKTAAKGDVVVSVKNPNMDTTKLTVAQIVDEEMSLTCEKPVEIVAGKEEKSVTFKLAETTKETINKGRKADFTIENGFIAIRTKGADNTYASALETIKELVRKGDIELPEEVKVEDIVSVEADSEGKITGFTVVFDHIDTTKASELEFTLPVQADINTKGDVKVKVEGRALSKAEEVVVATAKAPYEIAVEAVELKVGLNGQAGGKITITETAPAMLEKGYVSISMEQYAGITFKKGQDLSVKAENLKIKDVKVTANEILFQVERTSDEAGKVTIENIEFNVDRTAPEGSFDLAISGEAISKNTYMKSGLEELTIEKFVTIGTKNTEDIATGSNGLKKGTASFSINSTKYTLNGVEKTMDGAPYLANGRTMIPVRYVSEAFGIEGNNIAFDKGVVTLFAGNRIVQLTNGSNIALVNGVKFPMEQAVAIKDGRTYIPVGEVGRILGVSVDWNNETKTATFTN